jgi:hypothetical protein
MPYREIAPADLAFSNRGAARYHMKQPVMCFIEISLFNSEHNAEFGARLKSDVRG